MLSLFLNMERWYGKDCRIYLKQKTINSWKEGNIRKQKQTIIRTRQEENMGLSSWE